MTVRACPCQRADQTRSSVTLSVVQSHFSCVRIVRAMQSISCALEAVHNWPPIALEVSNISFSMVVPV
jgi:hypothetical protein